MRTRLDLSGYWHGRLELNPDIDTAAPSGGVIERDFYVPLPWNKQIEHLRWPGEQTELSGVVRPVQNQNFRDAHRKFNEGTITYIRWVDFPMGPLGPRVFLVFEGSNYRTAVRVNQQDIGTHDGGHLGFEFEITRALNAGTGFDLEITVDNLRRKDACPQEQFNWQNYGGLYRPVRVEWRPLAWIDHFQVQPGRDKQGWYADVSVSLAGDLSGAVPETLSVELRWGDSADIRTVAEFDTTAEYQQQRIRVNKPPAWAPGKPNLITASCLLEDVAGVDVMDRVDRRFGFRTVETRGSQILLNGEPVRLLGAAWHEQHPTFGSSVPGWQVTRDIQLMKQVGLNAIRAAHYPHAQAFYDACDREGMLVVAELPCWQFNSYHFASAAVRDLCVNMAREMVAQLGHHPCIIGWVIQNESKTFEPGAAEFFRAIHDAFKEADATRFTLAAESPEPPEHLTVVKKVQHEPEGALPPTAEFLDVLGVNCYAGWYANKSDYLPKLLDHVHGQHGNRPLLVTEFGAEGILGQRSLEMHPWTEDYQSELICRHIREILARDWVAGFFLWLFIDYEAASITIRGINAKGLVDEHRRPKLAFNEVKKLLQPLFQRV